MGRIGPNILIEIDPSFTVYPYAKEAFEEAGLKVDFHHSKCLEKRKELIKDCDILSPLGLLGADLINAAEKLKMIQVIGIGFDYIDVKAASKRGIVVCNTGGVIAETVAEHAWALLLDLARKVTLSHIRMVKGEHIRDGKWWRPPVGVEVYGKTIGIIGLGNIGRRVARIAKGFDMKILAYDPYLTKDVAQLHSAELTSLDDLLREADFICITTPLTDKTRGMIGEEEFSLMKPDALLINVSRGPIIQEGVLIKVLKRKAIGGAGLDVFEEEPLPLTSELRNLDNVILTPHIAGTSHEAAIRLFKAMAENIKRFLQGERPNWIINLKDLEISGRMPKVLREI